MKKKVYFIISSLVMIVMAIKSIIYSDELISSMIESFINVPGDLGERMLGLFQNSGYIYLFILSLITIILNIVIMYWTYNDNIIKNKEKAIAISIICIFTSLYPINELIAIINIIVLISLKRVNKKDFPDKKKELPVLKREEVTKEKIIYAVLLLAIYFSQLIWKDMIPNNNTIRLIVTLIFYIVMIILSLVFFKDLLKENFKVYKNNFKAYMQNLLPVVGKFYLGYLFISMIIFFLADNIAKNQNSVEQLPIYVLLPLAIIYAPIVEECLFRGCIRRFIKNDKIFIVVSGITFGLLHTFTSEDTIVSIIIMAVPYATLGGFLAYLYTKSNNMLTNMSFHAFQNTIAAIMTILIKGI